MISFLILLNNLDYIRNQQKKARIDTLQLRDINIMRDVSRDINRNLQKQNEEKGANNNEKAARRHVEKLQVSDDRAMQKILDQAKDKTG